MSVITIQIDAIDHTRYEKKDMELLLFAVHNMMEELIPSEQRLSTHSDRSDHRYLDRSPDAEDGDFRTMVYGLTEQVQQHIYNFLKLQFRIGISCRFMLSPKCRWRTRKVWKL